MNARVAIFAIVFSSLGGACGSNGSADTSESEVRGVPIGEIRGASDISATLRARLLDGADPATNAFDVSRVAGESVFALRPHLGQFVQAGSRVEYRGGLPTPFSIALWHQVLSRVVEALSGLCATRSTKITFAEYFDVVPDTKDFRLAPSVAKTIRAACTFTGDEAARRLTAGTLWDTVMGRGGSLAKDKEAFVTEFSAPGSAALADAPKARVSNMMLAMMFNPHFLLSK